MKRRNEARNAGVDKSVTASKWIDFVFKQTNTDTHHLCVLELRPIYDRASIGSIKSMPKYKNVKDHPYAVNLPYSINDVHW